MSDKKRLKILLKDCTNGFYQQMYFWGKDVTHPRGNLLSKYGFKKTPSKGLKGTSCYSLHNKDVIVELYGSCAAYYSEESSVVFLRQRNRFYQWISHQKLIPGRWDQRDLGQSDTEELFASMAPFLEWWISYEQWVLSNYGDCYRQKCYKEWNKINSRRTWLAPHSAMKWVKEFLELKELHVRPKQYVSQ